MWLWHCDICIIWNLQKGDIMSGLDRHPSEAALVRDSSHK